MTGKERWDVLNKDGKPLGRTVFRGENTLRAGEYHLVVHIWVLSSDGNILIQRRSPEKKLMPGEWAATGGAAISGEDSYTAAHRELFEELGIFSTPESMKKLTRIFRRNSLLDVWAITCDCVAEELTLQKSEVAAVKWVTRAQLKRMIEEGRFHNYGREYFQVVFSELDRYRKAREHIYG